MTVRTRITSLVVGLSLLVGILVAMVVGTIMLRQIHTFLDIFLQEEAQRLSSIWAEHSGTGIFDRRHLAEMDNYLLRISDTETGRLLFSQGDQGQTFFMSQTGKTKTVWSDSPQNTSFWNHGEGQAYRLGSYKVNVDDWRLNVQIAMVIPGYEAHLHHLLINVVVSFLITMIVLVGFSFFVVGYILRPVGQVSSLVKKISEKNLVERVPVEGNDEFSELGQTLNTTLDRLQFSFEKQRNLLFDTSHELKTPLTTMRLAVEGLGQTTAVGDREQSLEHLNRIQSQMFRMDRLVNSLLQLSSLESQQILSRRPVKISAVLESLLEEYSFLADAGHITMDIEIENETIIFGDFNLLRRAFSNILDNGLKYNVKGGRFRVQCYRVTDGVEVRCGNTGPGVPMAEQGKVFDQFYRAEKSRSTETGGFGLGLAMVKRIIQLHNGDVSFVSTLGVWTEVRLLIPVSKEIL